MSFRELMAAVDPRAYEVFVDDPHLGQDRLQPLPIQPPLTFFVGLSQETLAPCYICANDTLEWLRRRNACVFGWNAGLYTTGAILRFTLMAADMSDVPIPENEVLIFGAIYINPAIQLDLALLSVYLTTRSVKLHLHDTAGAYCFSRLAVALPTLDPISLAAWAVRAVRHNSNLIRLDEAQAIADLSRQFPSPGTP